jgi:hypothetical protein
VTFKDTSGGVNVGLKLWDSTTLIDTTFVPTFGAGQRTSATLCGYITNPAGNLRISGISSAASTTVFLWNDSGLGMDSKISAHRVH